jgi:hypothetical protein
MQVMRDLEIHVITDTKTQAGLASTVFEDLRINLFACQVPGVLIMSTAHLLIQSVLSRLLGWIDSSTEKFLGLAFVFSNPIPDGCPRTRIYLRSR